MTPQFIDADREDKWSASSAERVHYCPGSVALIKSIPAEQRVDEPTEAAESGTRIHKSLETNDASELDMTEGEITDRLRVLEKEAFDKWWTEIVGPAAGPDCVVNFDDVREKRLWVKDADGNKITSAKVDVAYFAIGGAMVLDFKSGFKTTTPAQRNFQAKVQAVAVAQERGLAGEDKVRVVIAQHRFTSMVTQADYTEEDLQRAYQEILTDDWRSKQPDAPRVPGDWCNYCPGKAHCKENAVYSTLPSIVHGGLIQTPSREIIADAVARLTADDLAFIERRRNMAEKLFDAVKARLKSLPKEDLARVGFELTPGRNQQECLLPNELMDWLLANDLIQEAEIMSFFKYTNGTLEEAVLPRIVALGKATNQTNAKKWLRGEISKFGFINYEASKTAPILKQL